MPIGTPVAATPTQVGAASTTWNVTYPAGISAGYLLVLDITANTTSAISTPSGWTLDVSLTASGATTPRVARFYKFAVGGESGTLAVTMPSSTGQATITRISGVDSTTPKDVASASVSLAATTAYSCVTGMTTVTNGAMIFAYAGSNTSGSGTFTPPTIQGGFTELTDTNTQNHSSIAYVTMATAGAVGTVNFVRSGSVRGAVIVTAWRPAGSGSTINGTAAGTQAGTSTGAATVKHPGTATVAGAGVSAAAALVKHPGTSAAVQSGTASATGTVTTPSGSVTGTASATQAGTSSAVATRRTAGTATATGAGTAAATGLVKRSGTATATGEGTGSAVAVLTTYGTASATQEGTASAVQSDYINPYGRARVPAPGLTATIDAPEARVLVDPAEERIPTP